MELIKCLSVGHIWLYLEGQLSHITFTPMALGQVTLYTIIPEFVKHTAKSIKH